MSTVVGRKAARDNFSLPPPRSLAPSLPLLTAQNFKTNFTRSAGAAAGCIHDSRVRLRDVAPAELRNTQEFGAVGGGTFLGGPQLPKSNRRTLERMWVRDTRQFFSTGVSGFPGSRIHL